MQLKFTSGNLTDKNATSFWLEMMQFQSLVGHQISFITACWDFRSKQLLEIVINQKEQRTNQKDKESIVYEMKD